MQTMTTTEAARSIGKTVFVVQREPITLTVRDEPVAVVLSVVEFEEMQGQAKEWQEHCDQDFSRA